VLIDRELQKKSSTVSVYWLQASSREERGLSAHCGKTSALRRMGPNGWCRDAGRSAIVVAGCAVRPDWDVFHLDDGGVLSWRTHKL